LSHPLLARRGRLSGKQAESLRRCLKQLRKKELVLTAWDAETTSFDFTHVNQGAPIDKSKGTFQYTIYDWQGERLRDEKLQQRVIAEVKEIAAAVVSGRS
jgi:uncharacterized protein involved in type VI secretion and phage assembly